MLGAAVSTVTRITPATWTYPLKSVPVHRLRTEIVRRRRGGGFASKVW